jgi:hypothetical protein
MPDLQSQATRFRAGGHKFRLFASVLPYDVVLEGTLSATPTFPALTVAYTVTAGSHSDVKRDQLVVFFDSGGARKGSLRVASGTISAVSLPIAEVAAGTVNLVSGDTFKVFDAYEIRDWLISATSAFLRDSRIALSDNNSNMPPIANCGGLWAGFTDRGQTYATVTFDASVSLVVDPDTTPGDLDYTWDIGDGSFISGSSSTAAITATFPVGFRHITLTVADGSTAKSSVRRVPVWVHDREMTEYPPLSASLANITNNGYQWSVSSFELPRGTESSLDTVPDGALVVFWESEFYQNTEVSYGSAIENRSHIKATQYLVRDSIHVDPDTSTVTFEAVSPLAILEQTPALPQLLVRANAPAKWTELKGLTVNRILTFIAYWHSSTLTYFDFHHIFEDEGELPYSRLGLENIDSIGAQLKDMAGSVNVDLTCDALGGLRMIRHPDYLPLADRDAKTITYALTTADVMEVDIDRQHRGGGVKFVRGEGIIAGTTVAAQKGIFANAPGNAPAWYGTGSETLGKQIVTNQAALNVRTALHFAHVNGLYKGDFVPQGARLKLPSGYAVFEPAYRDYVTFTFPASANKRGVEYDGDTRWTIEQVDINYDVEAGAKEVTLTLNHENYGEGGVTYIPPKDNAPASFPSLDANFDFGQFGFTLPLPGGLRAGIQTLAKFHANNTYEITTDFESALPSWVSVDLTALAGWPGGDLIGFEFDAYSPLAMGTGTAVNGWLHTDTHQMRITDIFGTPALTGIAANSFTTALRVMRFERGVANWGIVVSYLSGQGTVADWTTDGINWTTDVIDANYDTTGGHGWQGGIWLNPHTPGYAVSSGFVGTGTGAGMVATLRRTLDYGATWATLASPATTPGIGLPHTIVVPFTSGASPIFYPHTSHPSPFDPRLYRNNTDISPQIVGANYGPAQRVRSISVADDNANVMMVCGADNFQGTATDYAVFLTRNALSAAPTYTVLYQENTATPTYLQVYAANVSAFYLMGMGGNVAFSAGVTIESKIGNSLNTSEVVSIVGG